MTPFPHKAPVSLLRSFATKSRCLYSVQEKLFVANTLSLDIESQTVTFESLLMKSSIKMLRKEALPLGVSKFIIFKGSVKKMIFFFSNFLVSVGRFLLCGCKEVGKRKTFSLTRPTILHETLCNIPD